MAMTAADYCRFHCSKYNLCRRNILNEVCLFICSARTEIPLDTLIWDKLHVDIFDGKLRKLY